MPGPAIYIVVGVVGAVAAGIAFKEFVYDPHVAPKIEQWTEAYAAYRREKRKMRTSPHTSMSERSKDDAATSDDGKTAVELENMVERELHNSIGNGTLRKRNVGTGDKVESSILDNPNPNILFSTLSPSSSSSPTSNPFYDPTDPLGMLSPSSSEGAHSQPTSQLDNRAARGVESGTSNIAVVPPSPVSLSSISQPRMTPTYDPATSTPFTSADVSRSTSPFTDAASNHSFADLRSAMSFSDVARSESSFASEDFEHDDHTLPIGSSFIIPSHTSTSTSSLHTGSDDFLNHHSPLDGIRSPGSVSTRLSDEDWDRISEA